MNEPWHPTVVPAVVAFRHLLAENRRLHLWSQHVEVFAEDLRIHLKAVLALEAGSSNEHEAAAALFDWEGPSSHLSSGEEADDRGLTVRLAFEDRVLVSGAKRNRDDDIDVRVASRGGGALSQHLYYAEYSIWILGTALLPSSASISFEWPYFELASAQVLMLPIDAVKDAEEIEVQLNG